MIKNYFWPGAFVACYYIQAIAVYCRYIQGARFFDDSNANSSSAVHVDQTDSEVAVVNATSTSASDSASLRARFIGQGYKQVIVFSGGLRLCLGHGFEVQGKEK